MGKFFRLHVMLGVLSLSAANVFAGQVTLVWDANTQPTLGGYRLYFGPASNTYTASVDVGLQTSYTVSDLPDGGTYFFAVKAYDITGTQESSFSNEVARLINANGDLVAFSQESPGEGSSVSGIGLIRGWICAATKVEVEIDGGERRLTAFGTKREDTASVCGNANTGYGLTFNWNQLGDGLHRLRVLADDIEFSRVTFRVTTLGEAFLSGVEGVYSLPDFPYPGWEVAVGWSEAHQDFIIVGVSDTNADVSLLNRATATYPATGIWASQESPSEGSYESGIGLIRGWACAAAKVEVEIDGGERRLTAYGTKRGDTLSVCGDTDNGYGLTFNWNQLGDGVHTLRALADGVEFANIAFYVTTLGEDYLRGAPQGEYTLMDFPHMGSRTILRWSEADQNFVIVGFSH